MFWIYFNHSLCVGKNWTSCLLRTSLVKHPTMIERFQTLTKCVSQIKRLHFESYISWRGTFDKLKSSFLELPNPAVQNFLLRKNRFQEKYFVWVFWSTWKFAKKRSIMSYFGKVTESLSRIYTLLNAVLKVSENSQKNVFSSKAIWAVQSAT